MSHRQYKAARINSCARFENELKYLNGPRDKKHSAPKTASLESLFIVSTARKQTERAKNKTLFILSRFKSTKATHTKALAETMAAQWSAAIFIGARDLLNEGKKRLF
jgi:hypothetical protein